MKNANRSFLFLSAEHQELHQNFQRDESRKRGYAAAVLAFPNFICKKKTKKKNACLTDTDASRQKLHISERGGKTA